MLTRIREALDKIETAHNVRVLYACESGSRAWGFPSTDSDYDVRFIYCHPAEWYLTLEEGRDTLDFPVDEELDLAGWELRKALRLLRASNAALFEWLQSPIVYHETLEFRSRLAPLLPDAFNLKAGLHHYLGQLRRGVEEELVGEEVRLKRLFYALRSALAARWIRTKHAVPPMELAALREMLPIELAADIEDLLLRKKGANEKTTIPRPVPVTEFLQKEFAESQSTRDALTIQRAGSTLEELNAQFRSIIKAAQQ